MYWDGTRAALAAAILVTWATLPSASSGQQSDPAPPASGLVATAQSNTCGLQSLTYCEADNVCVDLRKDADNCGECGHSCDGKACVDGQCASTATGFQLGASFSAISNDLSGWRAGVMGGRQGDRVSFGVNLDFGALEEEALSGVNLRLGPFASVNTYRHALPHAVVDLPITASVGAGIRSRDFPIVPTTTLGADRQNFFESGPYVRVGFGPDFSLFERLRLGVSLNYTRSWWISRRLDDEDVGLPKVSDHHLELLASARVVFGARKRPQRAAFRMPVYAKLTQRLRQEAEQGREAYVFGTPKYVEKFRRYTKVAVVAPSSCENPTGSGRGRRAGPERHPGERGQTEVLATQCGVEMAMLESVLAEHGYEVYGWRTLTQVGDGRTPLQIIRDQIAQGSTSAEAGESMIVFQVNSLERTVQQRGDGKLTLDWRASDRRGNPGAPLSEEVALTGDDVHQLNRIALTHRKRLDLSNVHVAMADISAIDVMTGQNVWLYRWEKTLGSDQLSGASMLVKGTPRKSEAGYRWSPVEPDRPDAPSDEPQLITGARITAVDASPETEEQRQALRSVVVDFVSKFKHGTGTPAERR